MSSSKTHWLLSVFDIVIREKCYILRRLAFSMPIFFILLVAESVKDMFALINAFSMFQNKFYTLVTVRKLLIKLG